MRVNGVRCHYGGWRRAVLGWPGSVLPGCSGAAHSGSSYARRVPMAGLGSAEREGERLHASIEELDLELAIDDRLRLSDQLIQPLFDDRAVAALVHVDAVSGDPAVARQSTRGNVPGSPRRGGPMTR